MPIMNTSAVVISIIGVASSFFAVIMNLYLLKKYRKIKDDMVIFYYKFGLEVMGGLTDGIYLTFVILYAAFNEYFKNHKNFIIYLALPASSISAVSSIVTLAVSIERMLATYTPIFYRNYHRYFSPIIILILAFAFGSTEPIVLLGICNYAYDIPPNCSAFGCAINDCFYAYWTTHKSVIFAFICVFTVLLCLKLFCLNNKFESKEAVLLSRNIGPYAAVIQTFGSAIEALMVFMTLSRRDTGVQTIETSLRRAGREVIIL